MARLQSRQISQLHLYQVLHAVRLAQEPVSRAEVGDITGLSQPAVSSLTRRLLESGALVEVGARPSQGGGRRERELALNPDHAWVVGVKVAVHQLTVALCDFAGGVRNTLKVPLSSPMTQAALVRVLSREIEACLAQAGGTVRQRLAGVGVALPGFIDSIRGEVLWSPVLKPNRNKEAAPLDHALTEAMGVPVFIENDANMLALAEQWFGQAARVANVAVITLEHGLGLGLVLNGELYRGHSGLAAELAHLQVQRNGLTCQCGKQGCLEAYVAHYAMARQAQASGLIAGYDTDSAEGVMAAHAELTRLARQGNAAAREVFETQGSVLGQWIGNVVNLLAPQLVLLDGDGTSAADLYEPALRDAMAQAMLLPHRTGVQLVVRQQGDEVWARGAASLVLQRLDESAEVVESVSRHGFESENVGRRPDA
ncbi:MAG: ROK family protein [Rhizobacter sp.]|nr:ROK family protein [Rhizobacter sp.]